MPICSVDDGLDMPSSIYDSVRTIKHFNAVILGENINTLSGSCSVDRMSVCLCFYPQSTINGYLSIYLEISKVYGNGLVMLGSLIMCTVYTNKFTFGQLKLRLVMSCSSSIGLVLVHDKFHFQVDQLLTVIKKQLSKC